MHKLGSLRTHLLNAPLRLQEENLLTFVDKGKVTSYPGGSNQHFELHYQAHIIISEYTGAADKIMFLILQWMDQNNLTWSNEAFNFGADILDHEKVDIEISIDLTETIKVEQAEEGIYLHHCTEPSIEPVLIPATDWTLFINDEEAANWVEE